MKKSFAVALSIIVLISMATSGIPVTKELSKEFAEVVKDVNPAVVTVTSEKVVKGFKHPFNDFFGDDFFRFHFGPEVESKSHILGSGVIIDDDNGYILTNNHLVEGTEEIKVQLIDEREYKAEIIGTDSQSDVAVLKIVAENLTAVNIGDSDKLEVGEWVLAIGCPFSKDLSHTVTAGIVSAKGRSRIINGTSYEDFIQTDAAINPGNSGGALVNLDGEMVGINTAIATGGFNRGNVGVGFAIPINYAKKIMDDLIQEGRVIRAWLGVYIQDVDDGIAKALGLDSREGVIITGIIDESPAEEAKLKVEDVIVKIDDKKVRDTAHLKTLVSTTRPGTRTELEIIRKGRSKNVSVALEELPSDESFQLSSKSYPSTLGLKVENLNRQNSRDFGIDDEEGVIVISVAPNSRAAKGGIRRGDIIKRVGDTEISNKKQFREAIVDHQSNETILFLIKRRGGSLFITIENE
ncbi:MAG: Do family serine endopeptidase [Candidatus Marinimicrobia bacterium]|nr:Do family serine endopeptidase [Candidatus Neomarinimicrobiota bacterium]